MDIKKFYRFQSYGVIKNDSQVLGTPVETWNTVFTGNFEKQMTILRERLAKAKNQPVVIRKVG